MMPFHKVFKFFDRLEDKVRAKLSRHPIVYTLIGGTAIVLFWKGVWETADLFPFLEGPAAILVSIVILLASGLFVSFFIGDRIIISGLKGEKKLAEKTEEEVKAETSMLTEMHEELHHIKEQLEDIKKNANE